MPVAAHQVLYQLWVLASFIVDSLAIAAQTLIATALGQHAPARARQIADRLLEVRIRFGPSFRAEILKPSNHRGHARPPTAYWRLLG